MRHLITSAIAAAALAAALPAFAQSASSAAPTDSQSAAPAASASGSPAASTSAATTLSVGLPVKDKTGVVIGEIAELKPDASGQTATVKMGDQSFSVSASSFAVQGGAAHINATKAELQSMIASAAKGG